MAPRPWTSRLIQGQRIAKCGVKSAGGRGSEAACRAEQPRWAELPPARTTEAYCDGVELDLGPRKQRAVLALLLLNVNRVVSTERLIDDLWGDSPPTTARAALQVYVAAAQGAGYRRSKPAHASTGIRTRRRGWCA